MTKLSVTIALLLCLAGCSALNTREVYSISYRAFDIPGITILDYQYTKAGEVVFGLPDSSKNQPGFKGAFGLSSTAPFDKGDALYVQWREDATGVVRTETADLVNKLPRTMHGKNLTFIVEPSGLNVYVVGTPARDESRCKALSAAFRQPRNADAMAKAKHCSYSLLKIYPERVELLD